MNTQSFTRRARLGTALGAIALAIAAVGNAAPAVAQPTSAKPAETLNVSKGTGTLIRLSEPMSDVFVADDAVADVQVRSPTQLYVFGKTAGETTIYATSKGGRVVYATNVRVAQNLANINEVLHAAMPDSNITVTTLGQLAVMNGTVASPDDAAQAQSLVTSLLNPGKKMGDTLDILPVNRLKTATPLQVMLKVRIAEINRSMLKKVGVNLLNRDVGTGSLFGIGRGNPGTFNVATGPTNPLTGAAEKTLTGVTFNNLVGGTTLGLFGHIFGTDLMGTLDLMQNDGFVTTLAEPTLTALSGETASFLAGGEFPIPVSQALGSVTIEYKQYGVGLAFTPIVLNDGRISMRVRPEVSELNDAGSVKLNGFVVPALTTRRAETTVELGSGQSFMIAGLLQNRNNNSIEKAPFLGDIPILGALFRSTSYQRNETELVIIVTPYLVRPVSGQLAAPTQGYRAPTDFQQVIGGQVFTGVSGPAASVPPPGAARALPGATTAVAAPGFKL
jgi:pilus assembly protein CpaC